MKKLFFFTIVIISLAACSVSRKTGSDVTKTHRIKIETDSGTITARLYSETPLHTHHFLDLVKKHFYDGLLFHRVIDDFMIQGGDPDSRHAAAGQLLGEGGSKKTIAAEFRPELFHRFGAIAAAREGDEANPSRASSFSQFYIIEGRTFTDDQMDQMEKQFDVTIPEEHRKVYRTEGGAPFLDGRYTVFGQVESGFDVVRKIAAMETDQNNRPLTDIRMKITILK